MVELSNLEISAVLNNAYRLDAGAYNIKNINAIDLINKSKFPKKNLCGTKGLCLANYPLRFKRTFCSEKNGLPIYQPSQILEISPEPYKYISPKTKANIKELRLIPNQILLTRSGTVGKISFVSKTLENKIFSDDLIRIIPSNFPGYIYAFLSHKIGNTLLTADEYGSVISHIEPEHLEKIQIPYPEKIILETINNKILKSFNYRDESNKLIIKAEELLNKLLKLNELEKKLDNLDIDKFKNFKITNLELRLDASYHNPEIDIINNFFRKNKITIKKLTDKEISSKIKLSPRFKRKYIENTNFGYKFIGGKNILELNTKNYKILSKKHHEELYENSLKMFENNILITCSGTIGKVNIVSKHLDGWAVNQHVMQVFPKDIILSGYLYVFLKSKIGQKLIKRFTYGSVVDEIDDNQLQNVIIPLPANKKDMDLIGNLVRKANEYRHNAYLEEESAYKDIDDKVLVSK